MALAIGIADQQGELKDYEVRSLDPRSIPGRVVVAWVLLGPRTAYRVIEYENGQVTCDCPDASYRKRMCKHVRSLRTEGLLREPRQGEAT